MRTSGTLLCLASAAAFGAMGVFGTLAYGQGATVGTLLAGRFALAAALSWCLLVGRGTAALRGVRGRDLVLALALGAAGYAAQAGAYFAALERIGPSLVTILVYAYPAIVCVAAIALRRDAVDARRLTALALTSGGIVLVVAGAGTGALDPLGMLLALAAAILYSAYVLVGESVAARVPAQVLTTLVCTGAAISLSAASALLGQLRPGAVTAGGWTCIGCIAVVSTVAAIGLLLAALPRLGPTRAAIVSTAEPLVAAALALAVFGDALRPAQLAGGALVLGGVLVLGASRR